MNKRNTTFTILSAIAMILVIMGHLGFDALTFCGLFPYYSYHVLIFVFVSGYFYKPENETQVAHYILHKVKMLLVPYFLWNLVYGLIAMALRNAGFQIGGEFTLWNLFVAPFIGGHQFMYNATAWFVPALFMLEVCNVVGRKLLSAIHIKNEWLIMALYLAVGCFAVFMAKRGSVYDYYKIPGRLMVMAPSLQLGRLYREKLEKVDLTPSIIYIPLLLVMNLVIGRTHGGLAYSVVWVTGFANTPLTPFITALTGIALWLRISKLLARLISKCSEGNVVRRFVEYFGAHTYDVMMHQLIIFMAVKEVVFLMYKQGVALVSDFDVTMYMSDVYYSYVPGGIEAFKLVYVICAIAGSLAIGAAVRRIGRLVIKKKGNYED